METPSTPLRMPVPSSTRRRIKPTPITSWPNYHGPVGFSDPPVPLNMKPKKESKEKTPMIMGENTQSNKENCAPEEDSQRLHAVVDSENAPRQGLNAADLLKPATQRGRTPSLPNQREWTMKAVTRIVIFVIIRKLVDAELRKNCVACASEAQESLECHSCIKNDKKTLSRYVRNICSTICFKNLIYVIILVSHSLKHLMLTKDHVAFMKNTVEKLSKSEGAIYDLKSLLKSSDKPIFKFVQNLIKAKTISMFSKE